MVATLEAPRPAAATRPLVLYVDDQIGNLTAFRASMRRFADVETATSGEEALELLARREFPIVISDQRMNGMSGSEFLARAHQLQPDSVRILLTAYADFAAVVSAVNEGRISRLVQKPWDRDEMRSLLSDSAEIARAARRARVLADRLVIAERGALAGAGAARVARRLAAGALDPTSAATVLDTLDALRDGRVEGEAVQTARALKPWTLGGRPVVGEARLPVASGDAVHLVLELMRHVDPDAAEVRVSGSSRAGQATVRVGPVILSAAELDAAVVPGHLAERCGATIERIEDEGAAWLELVFTGT